MLLWIVAGVVIVAALYVWNRRRLILRLGRWKQSGEIVPHLEPALLANFRDWVRKGPTQVSEAWRKAHGPLFYWWVFYKPRLAVTHPEHLEELLAQSQNNFTRNFDELPLLVRLLGEGIIAKSGADWQRQHRLLYKAFTPKAIRSFLPLMKERIEVDVLKYLEQNEGDVVMMNDIMEKLTIGVLVRTIFGTQLSASDVAMVQKAAMMLSVETNNLRHSLPFFDKLPLKINQELNDAFAKILANPEKDTFLASFLQARDEDGGKLSDREAIDNCRILLFAGTETTAVSLTWTTILLAQHPAVLAKVREEVDPLLSRNPPLSSEEILCSVPYLDQVCNESLRLKPTFGGLPSRQTLKDEEMFGGVFPKGTVLDVSVLAMQRSEAVWNEPWNFDPDRFSPERVKSVHPFSHIPFGGGRRVCLGKYFALDEMRLVIAYLVHHFNFELIGPVEEFCLRSADVGSSPSERWMSDEGFAPPPTSQVT